MSTTGKSARLKFRLNGVQSDAPVEWEDINIVANFDNEGIQANITTDQFSFTNNELALIRNWITDGLSGGVGIFEGLPFEIEAYNIDSVQDVFAGFLDLTDNFEDQQEELRLKVKIKEDEGIQHLSEQLQGITYQYLEDINVIKVSDYVDIKYVAEKKINLLEILISNIMLFLLLKELFDSIRRLGEAAATGAGDAAGGIIGPIGAAIFFFLNIIIEALYIAAIVVALINMFRNLFITLLPPVRTSKAIFLRKALEKVLGHFGYTLVSPIKELDNLVYLPSNLNLDEPTTFGGLIKTYKGTPRGIPNSTDFGYICSEMFELAKNLFNAKFALIGNELHMRWVGDPFWDTTATYEIPSILQPVKRYNTEELKGLVNFKFRTDITDTWTIDNFTGTNIDVITDAKTTIRTHAKYIDGSRLVNYNVALGNRKDKLNPVENFLLSLAYQVDNLTSIFGKGTNFAPKLLDKVGVLKVSDNNYSQPKLLYVNPSTNKLPVNHRDKFSAGQLYTDYHIYDSFVEGDFNGQKEVYTGVEIPFGFEDFKELIANSHFRNFDGRDAQAVKISWNIASDRATLDYFIREPYTKNLLERTVEP